MSDDTARKKATKPSSDTVATVGYEAQLWQMADALRGSMDAVEYKHVCLGLLFLNCIADAFEEKHAQLIAEKSSGADPEDLEDPDEYRAQSIFWVPPEARWQHVKVQARQAPSTSSPARTSAAMDAKSCCASGYAVAIASASAHCSNGSSGAAVQL
ncbi:MAG: type I restriction-modification system subunit M N-terminal domain-containing protein [Steroidobacteraceae bacterium]